MTEKKEKQHYLELISGTHALSIKPLSGKRLIFEAKSTFSQIDNFSDWNSEESMVPSSEKFVEVYRIIENTRLKDIIRALPGTLADICLTQDQIIEFCEQHILWLGRTRFATIFLCKEKEQEVIEGHRVKQKIFIVKVYRRGMNLKVFAYTHANSQIFGADYENLLVVPLR
jgi:hypothetical protein